METDLERWKPACICAANRRVTAGHDRGAQAVNVLEASVTLR